MPTRTPQLRRAATASTTRFGRSSAPRAGAGRFARPLASPKSPARGRKQQTGMAGKLTSAMTALPTPGGRKQRGRKGAGGAGKAKPAMALLAAAGAVLGRRQIQKRRGAESTPATPAPVA